MTFFEPMREVRPIDNLRRPHFGVVVDNVDPEGRARIRCVVPHIFHAHDGEYGSLPWCYPAHTLWSVGDGSVSVPPLFTVVRVGFVNGDIYTPLYVPANMHERSRSPLYVTPPERPPEVAGGRDSRPHEQSIVHMWSAEDGPANWLRVDKQRNTFELFMGSFMLTVDGVGNLQVSTDGGVDFNAGETIAFRARNVVMEAGDHVMMSAGGSIGGRAGRFVGWSAGSAIIRDSRRISDNNGEWSGAIGSLLLGVLAVVGQRAERHNQWRIRLQSLAGSVRDSARAARDFWRGYVRRFLRSSI